jgi:hypothetical protein
MIDFAGLVGKIAGKMPTLGQGASPEPGVAIGGEFAALVQFAAQAGLENGQAKLRLVVDNGAAPDPAMLAVAAEMAGEGLAIAPVGSDDAPSGDGSEADLSDKSDEDKDQTADAMPTMTGAPAPIVAAWSAVPVTTAPKTGTEPSAATPVAAASVIAPVVKDAATTNQDGEDGQDTGPATAHVFDAKTGILASALRALSPRSRAQAPMDKADASVQIASAATVAASDEAQQTFGTAGKSSNAPTARAVEATALNVAAPSPLRAIVDGLPPVVQSELGTPSVRGVAGPSTGETLGDRVIDMGVSGQWIDRVAKEISALADGSGHSRFTLNPPHLGKLQVDLWHEAGATNIRLLTETDEAAQRLTEGRPALQADARIAALSFGAITVEKAGAPFDAPARDQGGQRHAGDLSGQGQQQQAEGQAQARAGNAQGSDWISRSVRSDDTQTQDAAARAPDRATNGRVRFA